MSYELLMLTLTRRAELQMNHFCQCLGQHSIASYLEQRDFRAKVHYDDILNAEKVIRQETETHGVRCIGFYVGADNVVMVGNLIRSIRSKTQAFLFVGGPEAAALGEDYLRDTGCNAIIVGEGERPVFQLLSYLEDGAGSLEQIGGLRYFDESGVYHDQPLGPPLMNLDAIPWPDRRNSLNQDYRMGRTIGLLTGRGCPFHCAFCYEGAASKTVRLRSVEHVMSEIDEVRSYNPKVSRIDFFDDTFTLYPDRVYAFCEEMKRRSLRWICEGHVACLHHHPEMIERMVDAGLIAMQIGIESGSARVLSAYQKNTTPEMIEEVVRLCHRAGLPSLEGNYIIGGALESEETLKESLAHAKRLIEAGRGMLELHTVFFSPYYGTPITKAPEQFGMRLFGERVQQTVVSMHEPVCETQALSAGKLADWKRYFDHQLLEHYRAQAKHCIQTDVLRGPRLPKELGIVNPSWHKVWLEIPHLEAFLRHGNQEDQIYAADKYPIRVGFGVKLPDGSWQIDDIRLAPVLAKAWRAADGRHTADAICGMMGMALSEIEHIYRELNRLCLVYFSLY